MIFLGLAAASLIHTGLALWSQYELSRHAHSEYQKRAKADQQKAAQEIADRCAIVIEPAQTVRGCLAEEIAAYQAKDTTNQDLKAQQDMALWALWMFVATAVAIPISLGGLIALLVSLRQTRHAISTDRSVGHAQVRAYLSIAVKDLRNLGVDRVPMVELTIVNSGQSPAYEVYHVEMVDVLPFPLPDNQGDLIVPSPGQTIPQMTVPVNGQMTIDATGVAPLAEMDLRVTQEVEDRRLYVAGVIYYRDVFKDSHKTKFCLSLIPSNGPRRPVRAAGFHPVTRKLVFAEAAMADWEFAHVHNEAD